MVDSVLNNARCCADDSPLLQEIHCHTPDADTISVRETIWVVNFCLVDQYTVATAQIANKVTINRVKYFGMGTRD